MSSSTSTVCPTCCEACLSGHPKSTKFKMTRENRILVGSLSFDLSQPPLCNHRHAKDGWHYFDTTTIQNFALESQQRLGRILDVLITNQHIEATIRNRPEGGLIVRVYLDKTQPKQRHGIPASTLRRNPASTPRRRQEALDDLRELLPLLTNNSDWWVGLETTGFRSSLVPKVYTIYFVSSLN